jgi:hypothetical protein
MEFLILLVLIGVAYLIWRISDQLPDLIFRISEIQRDIAEIRRGLGGANPPAATRSEAAPQETQGASD